MTEKRVNGSIGNVIAFVEEMKQIILSVCEDVPDSESLTEAWNKVDRCYRDLEAVRNYQRCTGAKSFSVLTDDVEGHTKYLQGINLPIMVNSIIDGDDLEPSDVAEMHIGMIDGKDVLLITPSIVG